MPRTIAVAGAGKIGQLITTLLCSEGDINVILLDKDFSSARIQQLGQQFNQLSLVTLDAGNREAVINCFKKEQVDAVISCLPYYANLSIAQAALETKVHYFDLTEDTRVTQEVKRLATDAASAFVPQCGLAPGFVGMMAYDLMQTFETIDTVKLRVGALPQHTSHALRYALTWSTEGVINQYGNACHAIKHGEVVNVAPLDDVEACFLEGEEYEAFNTSGGLGSLIELQDKPVHSMTYKTLRFPGHAERMRFLVKDLRLNEDRETLQRIFERSLPKTTQDQVIIYVSVSGHLQKEFIEKSYFKKVLPQTIAGLPWTAIQITTAAGVCAVMDLILSNPDKYQGFVHQESLPLPLVLENRFGQYYQ